MAQTPPDPSMEPDYDETNANNEHVTMLQHVSRSILARFLSSCFMILLYALGDSIARCIVNRVDVLLYEAACLIVIGSTIRFLTR